MRKYVYVFLLIIVIVVACRALTPSLLQEVTNIVSIISAVLLVFITLILYNKFNGSQALVDEQTKRVVLLLKTINQTRFAMDRYNKRGHRGTFYNLRIIDYKKRRVELVDPNGKDYRKYLNLTDRSMWDLYTYLSDLADEPYLPKSVADTIRARFNLEMSSNIAKKELPEQYIVIFVRGDFKRSKIDSNGEEYLPLIKAFNNKTFDFDDFMYNFESLQRKAVAWLKKNNPIIFSSLNIEEAQKFRRGVDSY
jgi:hypothetical protein